MKTSSLAALLLLTGSVSAAELQLPYTYAFDMMTFCWQPVFECDYTSRTCFRGFGMPSNGFVGDVLDGADRTTVLRHIKCMSGGKYCINLDSGDQFQTGIPLPGKYPELPTLSEVIAEYRTVHQRCPNFSLNSLDLPESIKQSIEQGAGASTNNGGASTDDQQEARAGANIDGYNVISDDPTVITATAQSMIARYGASKALEYAHSYASAQYTIEKRQTGYDYWEVVAARIEEITKDK
jgi:hypothetical protein